MIAFLKEYFTFHKQHQRGFLFLWMIILLLLFAPYAFRYFYTPPQADYSEFDREIARFEKGFQEQGALPAALKSRSFEADKMTREDWEALGLSRKLVITILNYTSKGGRFFKAEDLKRIYGMDEATFTRIAPLIKFPQLNQAASAQVRKKETVVEINSADSAAFVKLKGIGPVLASRIIKYRKRLGGFVDKQQLTEVYGLDSSVFKAIEKNLAVNPALVGRININSSTAADLKGHPYINNWNIAKAIVSYREQHGKFKEIAALKKCTLVNEEIYRKIVYYLVAE